MANTEVGTAYVSIMASMKGFQKEVGSTVERTFGKVKGIVAGALATGAIAAFGKAAVDAYASYEQLVGGVDTLFKDASDDVQKYAAKAYKTAGLSANAYMEQATSFSASLLQSLGGDTKKAADYADRAIVDMSDNANKMGTSMKSIQDAYQGFAKQNYTMLDNLKLGYGGTKTEMQRLIKDANRVKQANGEMADLSIESFADVTEAIHIIQTEMGITGTTAEEAEQTITGSIASMKSAWENWMVGLGDENADLEELTNQLVDTVVIAAENLIPRIGEIIGRLAQTVASKAPEIASKLGGALLELMPPELNSAIKSAMNAWDLEGTFQEKFSAAFTSMQGFVSQKMGEIFDKIGMGALGEKMTGAFNAISGAFMGAVNGFSSALEEHLGPALNEVQPILDYFFGTIEDASPWMEKLADVVGTVLGIAVSAAIKIFWNLVIAIGNVIEFITDCYNAVKKFVDDVYNFFTVTVPQAITNLGNWFSQLPGKIAGGLSDAVAKVGEFATNVKNKAVEAGKSFLNGVKSGFDEAVRFVAGIPAKILNALGDLGSLLVESGKSMLRGLAEGIKQGVSNAIDAVKNGLSEIRSFFPFSPAKRGPFSGHGWVSYSGESIARAMGEGFTRGVPSALRDFEGGIGRIAGVTSALGASAYDVGGASATSTVRVVGERDAQLIGMLGEILRAMPEYMTPREFRRAVAACG